jgi:uncharacterized membrane protein
MSSTLDKYNASRNVLSKRVDNVNDLLETLENEAKSLSSDQQEQFANRLKILDDLIDIVIYHDRIVNEYIRMNPDFYNVQQLHEQLKLAQKYVNKLGGNWSIVTWGKLSDY